MLLLKNNHLPPRLVPIARSPAELSLGGMALAAPAAPGCAGRGPRQLSTSASSEGCADEP